MQKVGNQNLKKAVKSQASRPETSGISEYERHIMGYLVARMKAIYGPRFDSVYKTDDMIVAGQREWVKDLGQVIPPQYSDTNDRLRAQFAKETIDRAFVYVKNNMGPGQKCEWPNIGAAVGLVKDFAQPHSFFKPPALEKKVLPKEEALERIAQLNKLLGEKKQN